MTEQDQRTIGGTVAQFEAWLSAGALEVGLADGPDPATAASALHELFERSERGGADLHDPSAELIRWLTRGLARDEDDLDRYDVALMTLTRYLAFLRRHGLWRRSERAVQDCWQAISSATRQPMGLPTLGPIADRVLAERLARPAPAAAEILATGTTRAFVGPLRATLDEVGRRESVSPADVATLTGFAAGSAALRHWVRGLHLASLVRADAETGLLTPDGEVRDVGGCPPPSGALIETLVVSLVRAVLEAAFDADVEEELISSPRLMGTLLPLLGAVDESIYLADPDDTDDTEDSTTGVVAMSVASMLDGEEDERYAALTDDVLAGLESLERFGVLERTTLPQGQEVLVAPEPFRVLVARAVADVTGCVGTEDDAPAWEPVELPSPVRTDVGFDLLLTLEHDPQVWRRIRVSSGIPLHLLHRVVTASFGWRGMRRYVVAGADGTRRFAPSWLLRSLHEDADRAVTDAAAATLGAVLRASGDTLHHAYGAPENPWRVRITVERVMSGCTEPIQPIDGGGDAPAEPTFYEEQLRRRLPACMSVPVPLGAAWAFMESRGWMSETDDGAHLLTPGDPTGGVPGMLFHSGTSLTGFFAEGSAAHERLAPLGLCSLDGGIAALWLDDDGATRVVLLGAQGQAYVLADSAEAFVSLLAIGYRELGEQTLGSPPQEEASVAAVAPLREWVQRHGATVPEWPALGDDTFTTWVARHRGRADGGGDAAAAPGGDGGDAGAVTTTAVARTHVEGEIVTVLQLLGAADGGPQAQAVGHLLGIDLEQGQLRLSGAVLHDRGVEVQVDDGVISTVWVAPWSGYPRPEALLTGLGATPTAEQVVAALGEPERTGPGWVRYAVDGGFLHLQFGDHGLTLLTAMVTVP